MRELVYLSERKLAQFDLGKRRRFHGSVNVEGQVGMPGIAGLKIGSRDGSGNRPLPSLDDVIKAIAESSRPAYPLGAAEVRTGDWVEFHAPLRLLINDKTVVLLDDPEPHCSYEFGTHWRLLLHGSAASLWRGTVSDLTGRGSDALRFIQALSEIFPAVEVDESGMSNLDRTAVSKLDPWIHHIDEMLSDAVFETWMAGYARVTGIVRFPEEQRMPQGVVLATPLFVEYTEWPSRRAAPQGKRHRATGRSYGE